MSFRSDLADYTVQLHRETEKAWLVSDDGEIANAVWIPKSQGELEAHETRPCYVLTIRESLAIEKGLA